MKKFLASILSIVLMLSVNNVIFAQGISNDELNEKTIKQPYVALNDNEKVQIGNAEYLQDLDGNLIKISDLLTFDSQEEADIFIDELKSKLNNNFEYNALRPINNRLARSYHYTSTAAKTNVAAGLASVNLKVDYATSWPGNRGKIIYQKAYTQLTGLTVGLSWKESYCDSYIISNGKDIYARTAGTVAVSLVIQGFVEFIHLPVNMSGYVYAIR